MSVCVCVCVHACVCAHAYGRVYMCVSVVRLRASVGGYVSVCMFV